MIIINMGNIIIYSCMGFIHNPVYNTEYYNAVSDTCVIWFKDVCPKFCTPKKVYGLYRRLPINGYFSI